ncbi:putative metallophosphoesterase YkoQ [Paenibacillus sp. CCS19]|uniref:metallophosphoesterase n=1 Tax=Paenibacillus sp. CCS19 TaxID=3158387 RepID=UPI002567A53E|nr:metallophosphoesterase [Paenibacillus cellulosilyticus]GMK37123.1 putative metallophosphoesterase YkoQ [Paenibacillus cellulosilyticus]
MDNMWLIIAMIAAAALSAYVLLIVPTQWLKLERIQVPSAQLGIRVLQISDVHVEFTRISHRRISRIIKQQKPDYICVTGDFTQKAKHLPKVKRYAEAIGAAGIPVYAVLGNHDYRLSEPDRLRLISILEQAGFTVLLNDSVLVDGKFRIVGIDDFGSKKSDPEQAFAKAEPEQPVIVITHDPNVILHLKPQFRYFMAGHFHGMQFNVPPLFRYINKGALASSGIIKGLHRYKGCPFYISRGMGQTFPNARLFISCEVTLHEL